MPTRGHAPLNIPTQTFRLILAATWLVLAGVVAAAFLTGRRIWAVDAVVFAALLGGLYLLRSRLRLTPALFTLLCTIVVAHGLAVFGLFGMTLFGVEYDSYIHSYSSIVVALVVFHYVLGLDLPLPETLILTLLLALGLGLLNELVEFAGYRLFGRGEGFFLLGPGDIGATDAFENLMTDFFHDLYGNLAGLAAGLVIWRGRVHWSTGKKGQPGS